MATTLGIVLAGGRGGRLGAGPKALLPLGGRRLLDRALDQLGPLCDECVIVTSTRVPIEEARARVVLDPPGAVGPLGGLAAGLGAAPYERALALAVDLPLVATRTLEILLERLGSRSAVVPAPGGLLQPLAAVYAPSAAAALAGALARGERALVPVVRALDPLLLDDRELEALGIPEGTFLNLNTPDDLADVERRLAAGPAAGAAS